MSSQATPRRIGPLAKLPIFVDLQDQQVLLVGGEEGAAWKAELLLAAGAHIQLVAEQVCAQMAQLITHKPYLNHHQRAWQADDFEGKRLALGDFEDEMEAQAFVRAGHQAGILVNVVDKPEFCDFQFGGIVNRSPSIVAISTDGAAPILGQAIRQRVEAALPSKLDEWSRFAQNIRAKLQEKLPSSTARRGFWEKLVRLAYHGAPVPDVEDDQAFDEMIAGISVNGRVTLVGAGPGAAELLTLKAVQVLQSADVVLYDDLVSDQILDLARREAERFYVGKRAGRATCRQEDINGVMVEWAHKGKHVVRLKSGDPMIYGRAGEEIAHLQDHDVKVEIVPGVTASLALASRLGVSLTHRDLAHSVRFVTGHLKKSLLPDDLDWRGLADPDTTTLFYMGAHGATLIHDRLTKNGLSEDTPVVIAANISRDGEKIDLVSLKDLARGIKNEHLKPVLIGVGKVFGQQR